MAKFKTLEVGGFSGAIHGMRNPLKSYEKSDSHYDSNEQFIIGSNDYDLAKRLWKAGTEHRKYLRQIFVIADIWLPRYIWSEFDTYKIGTAANSESTMHTLLKEDFGYDQFEWPEFEEPDKEIEEAFHNYIDLLKVVRDKANYDSKDKAKYHQILKAMLPESFIQKRTVSLNYETLATMYRQRKNHKLPQWSVTFVSWIHSLPYSELITGHFKEE